MKFNALCYVCYLCFCYLPECVPADLVFLMDESSSIGTDNFDSQKKFVKDIIRNISALIDEDRLRVAMVTFSAESDTTWNFNKHIGNHVEMLKDIDDIPYDGRGTKIGKGIQHVREEVLKESLGSRPEAPKIVILLTDGKSKDDTSKQATLLRDEGATMLVLGVGRDDVDKEELEGIASKQEYVFIVDGFVDLSGILDTIIEAIPCPDGKSI